MEPIKPDLALPLGWESVTYAEGQPEYLPLPAIRSRDFQRRVVSRWMLTEDERRMIADGADVFLTMLTFGAPLQPVMLSVGVAQVASASPLPSPAAVQQQFEKLRSFVDAEKAEMSRVPGPFDPHGMKMGG